MHIIGGLFILLLIWVGLVNACMSEEDRKARDQYFRSIEIKEEKCKRMLAGLSTQQLARIRHLEELYDEKACDFGIW